MTIQPEQRAIAVPTAEPSPTVPAGLIAPLIGGFVAVVALAIGATLAGSPFDVHLSGAWTFGMGHYGPGLRNLGKVGVFGGLALLLVCWYQVIAYLRQCSAIPVRTVLVIFAVWVVPLLVAPPLFSQDAYSYVAQGTMVAQGINPYREAPDALVSRNPEVVGLVDPIWRDTAVPYGPLFLGLEAGVVKPAGHHVPVAVEGLRLIALGGVLLAAAAIPSLARRWGVPPSLAVAVVVLNPLTLLGLISPGHNDALMAGLLVVAMALLYGKRYALAIGVCALAAGIKAPALIGTAFVAWQWFAAEPTWRNRLKALGLTTAITLGVLGILGVLTGVGWGWVTALGTPGVVRSELTPTTDIALLAERFLHLLGFGPATGTVLAAARAVGYLAGAAIVARWLWRSRRGGVLLAVALSLLVVVALGPVVQPWYLAWGLFCLAPLAMDRWLVLLVGTSMYAAIATLPRFEPLVSSLGLFGDVAGLLVVAGVVYLASPRLAARLHSATPDSSAAWMVAPSCSSRARAEAKSSSSATRAEGPMS